MLISENYRECLVKNLTSIKDAVIDHKQLIQSEKEIQLGILERMWVLAQRYSILAKGVPTKLHIHFQSVHRPEDEIRAEFLDKLSILEGANLKLTSSLTSLRNALNALGQFLDELDVEHLTILDNVDSIQLPFVSCIEVLQDIFKYFAKFQSQINCLAILLRPQSTPSVERYKKLWQPNNEFEDFFNKSLATLHTLKKT